MAKCTKCKKKTRSLIDGLCYSCYSENPKAGTKPKRKMSHEESDIQTEFFSQFPLLFPKVPEKMVFAVPNGGSRHPAEAKRMKGEGVTPGVPDVIMLIPKKGFASLCLEFKTEKGRQSDEQKVFQKQAQMCGSCYKIVRSVKQALREVERYLN